MGHDLDVAPGVRVLLLSHQEWNNLDISRCAGQERAPLRSTAGGTAGHQSKHLSFDCPVCYTDAILPIGS